MGKKVAKFGGSSLADGSQFRKVRSIVLADEDRLFVVPSAPGKRSYTDTKVTDMLYECQKRASQGESFAELFDKIIERYVDITYDLKLNYDIMPHLEEVRRRIENGATADYAASRGEYLNGLLLSSYLGFEFVDAAELIRFDESGVFDAEATQQLCKEKLSGRSRLVIPGFYGTKPDGSIKTFSRGGSDITGAIIARGVDAEVYENWTDVSGFLMADPRIVNNPRPIHTLTYTELRELAYMGATVLHEESIFPVRQACIPIHVQNTNAPEDYGTMIVPDAEDYTEDSAITGVAGRKGFTVIALEKDQMNAQIGFAAKVLGVLARHGVSIEHMPTGIDTLSVIIADSYLQGKRLQVVEDLMKECEPDSLEIHENMAMLAVVGRGMIRRVGTSARVFTALANAHVNVRMIDQGSGEMNIIVGVEEENFSTAINAIYHAFSE
jgi:aspartate kinase